MAKPVHAKSLPKETFAAFEALFQGLIKNIDQELLFDVYFIVAGNTVVNTGKKDWQNISFLILTIRYTVLNVPSM